MPTTHMKSWQKSKLALLICECASAGSQFFIATHSPGLLGIPDAELLEFDDSGVHKFRYEGTSQYQVMELFINHRDRLFRHILDDSENNFSKTEACSH